MDSPYRGASRRWGVETRVSTLDVEGDKGALLAFAYVLLKALVWAVALLVLQGCQGRPPDTLELRLNLSPEDAVLARRAAADWEASTPARFPFVIETAQGCDTGDCVYVDEVPRSELDQGWPFGSCDDRNGTGCTHVSGDGSWNVHVRVDRGLRERWLAEGASFERAEEGVRGTFLHELGHALGLSHDDDVPAPSVMKATDGDEASHPTGEDQWQYWKVRH